VPVVYHLKTTDIFNNITPGSTAASQTCNVGGAGGNCDYTFVRETAYSEATNITTDTITARIYWDTDASCTKTQDCNLNSFFVYNCGGDSGCAAPTTICTGVEDTTCSGSLEPCYSDVSCTPASVTQMAQNDYLGFRVRIHAKQENVYFRYNSSARDSWFNVTEQTADAAPGNNDPVISWVNNSVSENPIEGSIKTIYINFNVTDQDGATDLNDTSAKIYLNKTGEPSRFNTSCTPANNPGNTETYTCAIDMQFYDLSGEWTINASIKDNSDSYAENTTETFTYGTLTAMVLGKSSLNFTNADLGEQNKASDQNPQIIDNTGNQNITQVNVTAFDLINSLEIFNATYFTMNATDGSGFGYQLQNNTPVTISNAFIARDIGGSDTNGSLYLYVDVPPSGLTAGQYNSYTNWLIDVS